MKTKLTILIEKKGENLEITYERKDLQQPETTEEKLILKYIETIIRYNIDNGFAPQPKTKEEGDGKDTGKQEEPADNTNDVA